MFEPPPGTRRDVVYREAAGYVRHKYWTGSSWSGWNTVPNKTFTSAPSIASTKPGRLDLVALDSAGTPWLSSSEGALPLGTWNSLGIVAKGAPTIARETRDVFSIYVTKLDNTVWERSWLTTGFGSWQQVTTAIGPTGTPSCGAGSESPGQVLLVCINPGSGENLLRRYWRGY